MKECVRCQSIKHAPDFYEKDRTCKECRKAMVRANRAAKAEQCREYDRQRANLPHRVAARLEYQQTESYRESRNKATRNYARRSSRIRAAQVALGNAVRDGKVKPMPVCMNPDCLNTDRIEGHHTHYDHPLGVDWLCSKCHAQVHAQYREWERKQVYPSRRWGE